MIAQTTGHNCGARAISTMRSALGYIPALPADWKHGTRENHELVSILGDCFPNRRVLVACSRETAARVWFATTENVEYISEIFPFGDGENEIDPDDYW